MTAVPGATGDSYYGADLAALDAALAVARGDQTLATARAGDALTIAASTHDLARHLSIAALAVRIEADTLDSARLTGYRADPPATRARAERILAPARDAMTRIANTGGCASPVFSLLETLADAELSRIPGPADPGPADPGPADPGQWHQVAASELAGPYLAGYAQLQEAAGLLARRRRREATAALRGCGRNCQRRRIRCRNRAAAIMVAAHTSRANTRATSRKAGNGHSPSGISSTPSRASAASGSIRAPRRPRTGRGTAAGGGVRAVVEAVGIRDVLAKSLGSNNHANVVKATIEALRSLRRRDEILKARGLRAGGPSNGEEAQPQS